MANATHTPLPWRLDRRYVAFGEPQVFGQYIKLRSPWVEDAWEGDAEANANATFIVRACNSHYKLLEALKKAESALAHSYDVSEWPANGESLQDRALASVRAAISNVGAQ